MRISFILITLSSLLLVNCSAFVSPSTTGAKLNRVLSLRSLTNNNDHSRPLLYQVLATPRESDLKPGNCNFFYNDEVSSHLHGYMLLFGLFAAKDEVFVVSFGIFAALAATATTIGILPANPRVPAVVAIATLATTLLVRQLIHPEMLGYEADLAWKFELLVCAVNVLWGFGGSWRTKEPKNGATFGF